VSEQIINSKGGKEAMSIVDELTRDSFLSKKAANRQSSPARRKRDVEIASEFAERKDEEIARDADSDTESRDSYLAADHEEGAHASDYSGIAINASGKDADTEFGSDMAGVAQYGTQTYSHAGVSFDKLSESEARICYSGLLSKSGADRIIGVYGYGSNQNWEDVSEVVLSRDATGSFTATIPITRGKNVNFAFRDSAENWDNNSGLNYTFVN